MNDPRNKVVVGNVAFYPTVIRQFLVKSHYFMSYDPDNEILTLRANHGHGGVMLFEIRNISYESAVNFAEKLGLKSDTTETPFTWSKWSPILGLYYDGSEDAETLRMEMLKLGIPHNVHHNAETLGLVNGQNCYRPPSWTTEAMLGIIREVAERYKEALVATP